MVLIPFAFYIAMLIHYDGQLSSEKLGTLGRYVLPIACFYVAIHLAFGTYRRIWNYANLRDIILLSEVIGLGTLLLVLINMYVIPLYGQQRLPIGYILLGGILTFSLSILTKYRAQLVTVLLATCPRQAKSSRERVLIVGVNEAAQQLATRICLGRGKMNYELAGFIDDDPDGQGMNINGAKILGTTKHIQRLVRDRDIDVIIIARRPHDSDQMWQLISACQNTSAQVKVLPDMVEVMEGRFKDPLTVRDVNVEDILGRATVTIDVEACKRILADKVVLVTGAAGSIGSELCRQILGFGPKLLLALDNNETGLYELNLELNQSGRSPVQLIVADVSDWRKVERFFQKYQPQVVFHAAAYKHVPMLEEFPDEAFRVNIVGTVIVSEMAHQYKAERFAFISTDKAVNPSSVMGASKRVSELWVHSLAEHSDTTFATVRFGNVIGSRGSVLPTFARQIEMGGPVTVTHPEMTRFFMSIPEAVRLVLQATSFSQSGDICMLEMGDEVAILDLAQRMIRLKGLRPGKDIGIKYVGIRPGEKLHEELAYGQESKEETAHPSIYRLRSPNGSMDRETLLGVISIFMNSLQLDRREEQVREALFQVANCNIDGYLNSVAGTDLMRSWHQLSEGRLVEKIAEDRIAVLSIRKRHMAEGVLLAPGT